MSKKTVKVPAYPESWDQKLLRTLYKESWDQKLLRKLFKKAQKAEKAGKE